MAAVKMESTALMGIPDQRDSDKLMSMLAAVAEMERDLMVERTHAGLARARKEGKQIGRPSKTTPEQRIEILEALGRGESVSSQARRYSISRANVIGIRETALN